MIPFKEFILFNSATLEAVFPWPPGTKNDPSDWTTNHYRYCKMGGGKISANVKTHYRSIIIPKESDYELVNGLDVAVKAQIDFILGLTEDTHSIPVVDADLFHAIMLDPKVWHKNKVTGRHYNGTNQWSSYPPPHRLVGIGYGDIKIADLPKLYTLHFPGYTTYTYLNKYQEEIFRLGICFYLANYPQPDTGEEFYLACEPSSLRIYYLNPIVNSLSVKYAKTTGNKELILTGLGFNNDDDEMEEGGNSNAGDHGLGWEDKLRYIDFFKLQEPKSGSWLDDFGDGIRDPAWTDEQNNGTIVESGDVLTIAIANGVDGDWWQAPTEKAPFAKLFPAVDTLTVITKLNSYTVNDKTNAGLLIGSTTTIPDGAGGYCFAFCRVRDDDTIPKQNGLCVFDIGKPSVPAYVAETTLPIWLRMVITGATVDFDYSTDGDNWNTLYTKSGLTWSIIGLYAKSWHTLDGISAPFEFFEYSYTDIPSVTLNRILGDFTIVSNTKVTIPAEKFPALAKGTYSLYLRKTNYGGISANPEGYAGDWRTDSKGRIYKGKRFTFLIDDDYVEKGFRSKRSPLILMDMSFKDKAGNVLEKPIAEMDVRTSNKIYEGLLLNYSSISRAVNDKAGTFKGTSMELDLSNHKKDYSKILHDYPVLKNQEVEIAIAQADEPESWKLPLLKMIVDDYRLKGISFKVMLKDLVQKIFNKTVPKRICTTEDYPNLSEDYIGAAMPEVLGLNVLGVGKYPGAVEAVHVDTVNHIYLASYRTLYSIDTVYSDYTAVGGWSVFYDHGGRTYIDFEADQENKVIIFDCKGYMFKDWNSINGYIENPAYILLYYIAKIMEVRLEDLVRYSFDEVAALFENVAEETSGRLVIQNTQRASSEMRQLLFDYETKAFVATDGRLEIGKKDISNYSSDLLVFDQADLQEPADRKWNQDESINRVKVEFDYYPSADKFKSGEEDEKEDIIEEIDETREDTRGRDREDRRGRARRM